MAKGSKAAALASFSLERLSVIPNDPPEQARRIGRNRSRGRVLLVTKREMLLAQLLLLVADTIAEDDRGQDFVELYNECRFVAEGVIHDASKN